MFRSSLYALTFLVSTTALAQNPPEAPPREIPMLGMTSDFQLGVAPALYRKVDLLRRRPIQKELNYTDDQAKKWGSLQKKADETRDEFRARAEQSRQFPDGSPERAALSEKASALQKIWFSQTESMLGQVLDRRQMTRLNQLQLQAQKQMAFLRPEIQEKLNMSPDQVAEIEQIVREGEEAMKAASVAPSTVLPRGLKTDEEKKAFAEKKEVKSAIDKSKQGVLKARYQTMQAVAKVLTKKQRAKYIEMLGEPFDLTKKSDAPAPSESKPKP